jgi:hypothetical protein
VATYYDIFGQKVQYLSSDPSDVQKGQVWYNSTSNTAKFQGYQSAAWSSAAPMPGGLSGMVGGGSTTSGLIMGGDNGGGFPTWPTATIEFNGTSWSGGGAYPTAGNGAGISGADQSTLIAVGNNLNGPITNVVNSYDGSTWSAETVYPASIASTWGFGPKTASLFFGGGTGIFGGSPFPTATNSYNGSAWTAGGALPSGRAGSRGTGILTAGLSIGANPPLAPANTETLEYDGSAWTGGGTMNNTVGNGAASGTQTAALYFGRYTSPDTACELYDGTSWSSTASMSVAHPSTGGFGTSNASAIIGGYYPGVTTSEEFTGAGPVTKTITTS